MFPEYRHSDHYYQNRTILIIYTRIESQWFLNYRNNDPLYLKRVTQTWKKLQSVLQWWFRALQCPWNSMMHYKGVAWWNPQILIVHPQSTAFHHRFLILNTLFSVLIHQIFFIKPQFSFPSLLAPTSVKSKGYLNENILKIVGCPTNCPQTPLALFATFSKSATLDT